ncbi:MAG: GntR family transcriptional regulator [Oscillospiraceae bacterium]
MTTNLQNSSSEAIYRTLKSEILDLVIKPGQSLGENELCARFNVSRTPVRSVLARLRDGGLVNIIPYKGTFVTLLNYDDITQLIYMRVAVESMVLRDFVSIATPIIIEKLRYIIRKQKVLLETEFELQRFYDLDSQLHEVWFHTTKKDKLWKAIQRAQVNYSRFRMLDIMAAQSFPEIIQEHEAMFDMIERKDIPALQKAIEHHLYGGIRRLDGRIDAEFADYFQKGDL